ncbi:MAG: nitrogen metabolism transcriptional regulator, NtrC, Fis Family [Acidobacteria bacterium]|nr:nitrogen metabolism transcriptional regulator, NtrC, Fis Family [Acidobacteriota bacterium]
MKSVLYLGCPVPERADTEKQLAAVEMSVVWGDNASFALDELQRRNMPVLLDLSRGAAALQIAREIRTQRASTLMFAVVDARRPDLTTEAVLAGMADVFARPLGGRRVANAIARELKYEARESLPAALENGDDLYGHSPAMRDVMALIARAAGMRAGVLIRGEEGTGRQVAARAIHTLQPHGDAAFVSVDCAACDGDELDAELFGAPARGQDAGDAKGLKGLERVSRLGRLHHARGGTIYLQNVAEAPTRVQARLARVLRDREAILIETGATTSLDVRPMAGADPAFDSAVHEGRVREDLFRRLSVIRIEMPALRNRREDIPALANYFLREICAGLHVPPKTLSRSALSLLSALPWRGNAAELRRLLDSIVTGMQGGRGIALEDILSHVKLDGAAGLISSGGTLKQARSRFEKEYIATVLEQHRGRISEAARTLGIQRTNLYRKMRSLKVNRTPK